MCKPSTIEKPKIACGEFIVRISFTMTGRGTCVAGHVASGNFRRDGDVRWLDGNRVRNARFTGFSTITERSIQHPPTVGLMLADAEPGVFDEGMTLKIYRLLRSA